MLGLLKDGSARDVERAEPFVTGDDQATYTAVAFRKEDEDLRALYDQQFAALQQKGTVATIMAKYGFGEAATPSDAITTAALCSASQAGAAK